MTSTICFVRETVTGLASARTHLAELTLKPTPMLEQWHSSVRGSTFCQCIHVGSGHLLIALPLVTPRRQRTE